MSTTLDPQSSRRADTRTITLAAVVSVLVHVLVLWQAKPSLLHPSDDALKLGEGRGPLTVHIAPPVLPVPAPQAAPAPRRERPPPAVQRRPPPRAPKGAVPQAKRPAPPPVIAMDKPSSQQAPATPAPPAAKPAAPGTDLSSFIESRRRARAENEPPSLAFPDAQPQTRADDDANARANRLAAANLAPGNARAFGYDPNRGGGIFSIKHVAYDYAEFLFYGWNQDARRNTAQLIEVRKGDNPDIRIAVVRKMIAIIRNYEQGDFLWESRRLGRYVTLSARQRDNPGLEEFMLAEFFDELRQPR